LSGFSPEWLRLREPLDAASRDVGLCAQLPRERDAPLQVIDLGAGTGANLRYLAPLLGGAQEWLLVDDDPTVLQAVEDELTHWARSRAAKIERLAQGLAFSGVQFQCRVRCQRIDLAADLNELQLPDEALVTASALLDLVSAPWLRSLAERCRTARARALFSLTYDGRMSCSPVEPEDHIVFDLFNRHQTTDKGFGPALGPAAAAAAVQIFEDFGYAVRTRPSDWNLGPGNRALQAALVDGWLEAALEIAPEQQAMLESWHDRRREHIENGRSVLRVGHIDLVGWLPSDADGSDD